MLLIGGARQRGIIGPKEDDLGASSAYPEVQSDHEIVIPELVSWPGPVGERWLAVSEVLGEYCSH